VADCLHGSVLLLDTGVGGWGRCVELLRAEAPPTVLASPGCSPPQRLLLLSPYLVVGLHCWLAVVSHYSLHGLYVVFPSERYLLSRKVRCVELDLELGKSLARPLSVLTMAAFPNVVFLLGIQIHLVCRMKTHFGPFWKDERR
jgi:hypothetical protein